MSCRPTTAPAAGHRPRFLRPDAGLHRPGLGRYLLTWAIDTAWNYEPERLTVNTCSLTTPRCALPACGFQPYTRRLRRSRPASRPDPGRETPGTKGQGRGEQPPSSQRALGPRSRFKRRRNLGDGRARRFPPRDRPVAQASRGLLAPSPGTAPSSRLSEGHRSGRAAPGMA